MRNWGIYLTDQYELRNRGPILKQISHTKIAIPYTIDQLQLRNCHFRMRKLFICARIEP